METKRSLTDNYFVVIPKNERLDRLYKKINDRLPTVEHLRVLLAGVYQKANLPVEPLRQKTHEELIQLLKITLAFYEAHNFDIDSLVL